MSFMTGFSLKPFTVRLACILPFLFILDWILGALCASDLIPHTIFLLLNFPFGILYVMMEHSWTGTHYDWHGFILGDIGSLIVTLAVILLQAMFYAWLAGAARVFHNRHTGASARAGG